MEELLSLKWNNHRTTFLHILAVLRDKQLYTDATLACDGKIYPVHKLVLSTCSDYFSAMLDRTSCKNPIIVLKDIKSEDLEALLDYMYLGEVNVRQSDLSTLIKAAECLRVKGLAVADDEPPPRKSRTSDNQTRRGDTSGSPPAKRKRRSDVEDGRDDVRPSKLENRHSSPVHSSTPSRPKTPNNSHTSSTTVRNNSNNSHSSTNNTNNSVGLISNSTSNIKASSDGLAVTNAVGEMLETVPCVKVEMEEDEHDVITGGGGDGSNALGDNAGDSNTGDMGDNFNLSSEDFKEEDDNDGGDLGTDLPEFLQQATANYSHSSFAGTSFQPDLSWQGSGDSGGAGSGMAGNFGATAGLSFGSSQQQDGHSSTAGKRESTWPISRMIGGAFMEGNNININIINNNTNNNNNSRGNNNSNHHHTSPGSFLPEHDETRTCDICGKTFSGVNQKFLLRRHRLTHTGERKFSCHLCPYQANQSGNLRRHLRFVHQTTELEGCRVTAPPSACDLSARLALMTKPYRGRQMAQLGDGSASSHQVLPAQATNASMQQHHSVAPSKIQQEQVSRLATAHADHLRLLQQQQSSLHSMAAAHEARLLLSPPQTSQEIEDSVKTSVSESVETEVSRRTAETSESKLLSFSSQLFGKIEEQTHGQENLSRGQEDLSQGHEDGSLGHKDHSQGKEGPDEGSTSSVDDSIICLDSSSPALPSSHHLQHQPTPIKAEDNTEQKSLQD